MIKALKIFVLTLVFGLSMLVQQPAMAQCANCAATIESNAKSGDKTAGGINKGIMFLLAMPYLVVAVAGYIWYKKYRRKNVVINMPENKLNLN